MTQNQYEELSEEFNYASRDNTNSSTKPQFSPALVPAHRLPESSEEEETKTEDPRYDKGAYYFVRHGLDHTLKRLKNDSRRNSNHVCGQELLSGIRDYALEQYGPMAFTLLQHWGINQCVDFGEIVFNLVEFGVLGKTESDRREDFTGGYEFYDAFVLPFLPKSRRVSSVPRFNHEDELEATA